MSRLDPLFEFLTAPGVRRIRRWASVVTVPAAIATAAFVGIEGGAALVALELAVVFALVLAALTLSGQRREAVLDLVMHPTARRAMRTELRLLWTIAEALLSRLRPAGGTAFTYHRGSMELGFALALIPVAAAELTVLELLLPASWFWLKIVIAVLSVYGVLALVSLALGLRVYPHRLVDDALELRLGQLYRAVVPLGAIEQVEQRSERVGDRTRLLVRDGEALLLVNGRVDVNVRLSVPVVVERPLGDPVSTEAIAFAADHPAELAERLRGEGGQVTSLDPRRRASPAKHA